MLDTETKKFIVDQCNNDGDAFAKQIIDFIEGIQIQGQQPRVEQSETNMPVELELIDEADNMADEDDFNG